MRYMLLALVLSCSQVSAQKVPPPELTTAAQLRVETQPGFVRFVSFAVPEGWEDAALVCREQTLKHAPMGKGVRFAYIAETYHSNLKDYTCHLSKDGKTQPVIEFNVKPFKYKEEKLKVDYRTIKLSKKDQERAAREQRMLNELYGKSSSVPYFNQPFRQPLDSVITSVYGNRRVYNNAHKSQHLGTDYRAAVGEPVPAVNRGKVLFSGDLFYTGGTVIIDHGLDIFSVYGHLSELKVEEGQIVNGGDIIALSGNTGRSSGPHLHLGIKIHGHYINLYSVIEESKKQFP